MQKLAFGGGAATGIVGVLFLMGLLLTAMGSTLGWFAVYSAVGLAVIYGVLGAVGILARVLS